MSIETTVGKDGESVITITLPDDPVNPSHYSDLAVKPIDAIEAWDLGFALGNAVKYIARHQRKGKPLEDLKKARWYLDRAIKLLESSDG